MQVTLADGSISQCLKKAGKLEWEANHTIFKTDFHVLPLGGYDAILGVQWLREVSPVWFDFTKQEMHITWKGQTVVLQQESRPPQLHMILDGKKLGKNW